jgi:hypothetical protein
MPAIKNITLSGEDSMGISRSWPIDRRTILQSSAAIAAVQFSSPFIIKARGETPVRRGTLAQGLPGQHVHGEKSRARRKSSRTGRAHRLQDSMAGPNQNDAAAGA